MINISRIDLQNLNAYRNLRLEGLKNAPDSFLSTYEEEKDKDFQSDLVNNYIYGAFIEGELVGIAGLSLPHKIKIAHRGTLYGVYVKEDYRGQGIAKKLVSKILEVSLGKIAQIHCSVNTKNPAAVNLYKTLGFETYGTEPKALKIGDTFIDEHLMVKFL